MANTVYTPVEKKILNKMFWNSGLVFITFTMTKMEANGFSMTMQPALDELYKDRPEEEKKVALRRHNQFFNTHAVMFSFIAGLTYALEKQKIEKGGITDETIDNIKVALMGPTAGMGDAFFFNCLRVIAAGVGIGLCAQGNFLGTLLFILIYGVSQIVARYYLLRTGYSMGTSFIDSVFESGLLDALTKAASILGMIMVGAMVATQVRVNLAWTIAVGDTSVVVGDIINSIMPGLLSILLVFGLMKLIKKGWTPTKLVLLVLFGAIGLAFFGIF